MVSFHSIFVSVIALSAPISAAVVAPVAKPAAPTVGKVTTAQAPVYSVRGIGALGGLVGSLLGGSSSPSAPGTVAAAPQPAAVPAPSFTSVVTSYQVVQTFQFYTTRSNDLNRLAQSFTSTDILNFARGLGSVTVRISRIGYRQHAEIDNTS
jgi:hypothetical protein